MSTTAPRARPRLPIGRKRQAPKPQHPEHIRPDGSRDVELPIIEHLRELRSRLMKAALAVVATTIISFTFVEQEVILLKYLAGKYTLTALEPTETFTTFLKVAFMTGLAMSMPFLIYQLYQFLAPGLTKSEKYWALLSLPMVALFFLMGVLFCYFIVLPSATSFLLGFGSDVVTATPRVSKFLDFVLNFLFAVGLAFETPVVIFILSKLGVATPKRLRKFRRWFYVIAFIVAAIITPTPDPINQTIVAVPIIILYEIGILFAWLGTRAQNRAAKVPA
jgi:sec-independent protein translocase protein TatC